MSLILEALRKSEAERRRGGAPNVYAEMPPLPPARSSATPPWVWPLLAAVVLCMLWLARGTTTQRAPAFRPAATPHPIATQRLEAALPPVPHLSPPPVLPPVPKSSVAPKPVEPAPAAAIGIAPPAAIAKPAPRAPLAPAESVAAPQDAGTLRLSDLSVDERKALPPLKLSMHMWNDDPAQRFVILDGNRLHEGDRIGDAVVTAITADGVVLDWNGRRLKLPIR